MQFRAIKTFLIMALIVAVSVVGFTANASAAEIGLDNAGFETGDLTGWDTHSGTTVVASGWNGYTAPDGDNFAVVAGGCSTNSLSQNFAATGGDTLSGWAFFDAGDYLPFNDYGVVRIVQGDTVLFSSSVGAVGDFGATPWTAWSWTAPADGSYTLQAYSVNVLDCGLSSYVGIDIVDDPDADGDGVPASLDCDDNDVNNYPGNAEIDDGQDNNCNAAVDEGFDVDGDGFTPIGGGDCDDSNDTVYPGATEIVDGLDNDCDGALSTAKGEQLIASGVEGKGLSKAPGLTKEFNSKSKAGDRAGKK